MPSKEPAPRTGPVHVKQQSPAKTFETTDIGAQQPAASLRRASLDVRSLTAHDMLQLQRTIGNRTLARAVQRASNTQRKEDPQHSEFTRGAIQKAGPEEALTAAALIVEDAVIEQTPGQMKKSEFLERLHEVLYEVGTEEYQDSNLTVQGCPYIVYWFEHYQGKDSAHIERAARKYVSAPPAVATAEELLQLVSQRARRGFQAQVQTGQITELPEDVPASAGEGVPEPEMIVQRQPSEQPIQMMPEPSHSVAIQRGCLESKKTEDSTELISKPGNLPSSTSQNRIGKNVTIPQGDYKEVKSGQTAFFENITTCTAVYVRGGNGRVVMYHWPFTQLTQTYKEDMNAAIESIGTTGDVAAIHIYTKYENAAFVSYLERTYHVTVTQHLVDRQIEPLVNFDATGFF